MKKEKLKIKTIVECILNPNQGYTDTPHKRAKLIAEEYRYRLKNKNAIDLDLLISEVVRIFEENSEMRDLYHKRYKYIFIDEFQDTNDMQMAFVNAINPENLFLVGDDNQSIYGFNGAKVDYILNLSKSEEYEVIRLEDNYRSTSQIVETASRLISNNSLKTEKKLIAHKDGIDMIYNNFRTFKDEINFILEVVSREHLEENCIITRTNSQINDIKAIFEKGKIPYRVLGQKIPALENKETKDILNLINLMQDLSDEKSFNDFLEKITSEDEFEEISVEALDKDLTNYEYLVSNPSRNETVQSFFDLLDECEAEEIFKLPATDCVYNLISKEYISLNYDKSNLQQLVLFMADWTTVQERYKKSKSINSFINWFKSKEPSDIEFILRESKGKGINITTAHSSKGLEFPTVFLVGMNQGLFPHKRDDIEESRRLCYVAITRAKEQLYVSWSDVIVDKWGPKTFDGEFRELEVQKSQFVCEMQN